jgi:hypothetical protein
VARGVLGVNGWRLIPTRPSAAAEGGTRIWHQGGCDAVGRGRSRLTSGAECQPALRGPVMPPPRLTIQDVVPVPSRCVTPDGLTTSVFWGSSADLAWATNGLEAIG